MIVWPISFNNRHLRLLCFAVSWGVVFFAAGSSALAQQRVLGIDLSGWQGSVTQTQWNNMVSVNDRHFAFIRSSRGGTTGFYNQSDPNNNNNQNTLSQRYDDPYFVQNITRATNAGMFASAYHFSRPDIIESTQNSGGIANTGTDEANHFMEMAGAWMRPGYLLPVHDLEAGQNQRTANQLAQFSNDFSDRIYNVMGIRPIIYVNGNYANILQGASSSLRNQLLERYPNLWVARPAYNLPNNDPDTTEMYTAHPKDTYAGFYGPWDDPPGSPVHPWAFWQYSWHGVLQGKNVDYNVAQGGIEFIKDHLVPAVWMNNSSGEWTSLANWNSGQTPIAPVQGPGQVARVGPLTLPNPRLPGTDDTARNVFGHNDTVILDRPGANITVTHSSGTHEIRKLIVRETLNITGGSLTVNYDPASWDSPLKPLWFAHGTGETINVSAQFSRPVTLSGTGSFSVHTLRVDNTRTFTLAGGTLTFDTLNLMRHSSNPARIAVTGNVNINPLNNATATIATTGAGSASGVVDLGGGNRTITVGNGSADVDLSVNVAISNGALTKSGPGTMLLNAANTYAGLTTVNGGILRVPANNRLGSTGVGTGQAGTLQLSGNLSYDLPLTIGGAGATGVSLTPPGNRGALDSLSGNSTWSGPITLAGTGSGGTDPLLNQVSAQAGSLRLSGVIRDAGGAGASWGKTGNGDVVLSGAEPNTYTGLTRLSGGRLIIEKDAALGAAGALGSADGNTFQLAGSASTLAFRAPAAASGFSYDTFEVINTHGSGAPGFGQVDNLGGDNTFAGLIALDGPAFGSIRQTSLGVTSGSLHLTGGLYARGNDGGPRHITKLGAGTLILSGDSAVATGNPSVVPLANSTFIVNAGTVELHGPSESTTNLPGVTTWNVNNGGTLQAASGRFSTNSVAVGAGGEFRLAGGSAVLGTLNMLGGGTLSFTGGTLSVGTVHGDITNQAGTLSPGASPGFTNINGDYAQQAGATLGIEIGGTNGQHDFVLVSGTATLGGVLDVSLINGFTPTGGQQFTVFGASGGILNDGLTLGGSAADLFNLLFGSNSLVLEAIGLPGDLNADGVVDAADYVFWRKTGGATEQFDEWRTNFGAGAGAGTTLSAAVPEPTSAFLSLLAASGLICLGLRRRAAR